MKKEYRRAVLKALESTKNQKTEILAEADIKYQIPGGSGFYSSGDLDLRRIIVANR